MLGFCSTLEDVFFFNPHSAALNENHGNIYLIIFIPHIMDTILQK